VEKVQAAYEAVAKEAGIEREPALSVVPGSRPRALSQRRSTKA
jgi:hypothetical protein